MADFERYIGVDYSGAQAPGSRLPGLRVFMAHASDMTVEIRPDPQQPKRHWSREMLAHWLQQELASSQRTVVGIDHGFSFPLAYFKKHGIALDWDAFLQDFIKHYPSHEDHVYVDFIRKGMLGAADKRKGNSRWRRLSELRCGGCKSVFHFDVPGSVAKSTHAGLPWLLWLRQQLPHRLHFWPFDGWNPEDGRHVLAEVYPSLWKDIPTPPGLSRDQQDALRVAWWLRNADQQGLLPTYWHPDIEPNQQQTARSEGWILGVC